MLDKIVWFVIQVRPEQHQSDIQGVFDTEARAFSACKNKNYFIGPLVLNKEYPEERLSSWPGSYYPLRGERKLLYPNGMEDILKKMTE